MWHHLNMAKVHHSTEYNRNVFFTKASQFLKTICWLFLCILNVKTAELFLYYKENVEMHIAQISFKKPWFNAEVPINCLSERVLSEQYISVFDGWFYHKERIATNFRRIGLITTLPDRFLSSIDFGFPIFKNYENSNDFLIGKLLQLSNIYISVLQRDSLFHSDFQYKVDSFWTHEIFFFSRPRICNILEFISSPA